MVTALAILYLGIIFLLIGSIPISYAQTLTNTTAISLNANQTPNDTTINLEFSYTELGV